MAKKRIKRTRIVGPIRPELPNFKNLQIIGRVTLDEARMLSEYIVKVVAFLAWHEGRENLDSRKKAGK